MFMIFFFKQKTAYEMRISDWSSDVCSSDLEHGFDVAALARLVAGALHEIAYARVAREVQRDVVLRLAATNAQVARQPERAHPVHQAEVDRLGSAALVGGHRSEEHTSELQSLMRISYAVLCLKKKTT